MCVPLVLAKQKKSKEVKWAREFYFEKTEKDQSQKEGKRNPQSCLLLLLLLLHNTPANVIISVHVREEILGHRLEGKYMF
jgi:hypothetical protein